MAGAPLNDAENRIVGMMVASAAADAIGIYTDQLPKQAAAQAYPREIVASHKANELTIHHPDEHRAQYNDGEWSEVTEMALCTLFSKLHDNNIDNLATRLLYLSRDGNRTYAWNPRPLGQPIHDIINGTDYATRAKTIALNRWTGGNREQDYKTGSNAPLIRIHPQAAFDAQDSLNQCFLNANRNCRMTHVDSRCSISVLIAAALLRALIRREVQTENQINPLIQKCKRHMGFWEQNVGGSGDIGALAGSSGARYYVSSESWAELSRLLTIQSLPCLDLENSNGEVWKCLSAGIFCLRTAMARLEGLSGQAREDNRKVLFSEMINRLVLEGGAAQANAAFAGALLGAYLGYDAIPVQARSGLSERTFLMKKCKLLCEKLSVIDGDSTRTEPDSGMGAIRDEADRRDMIATIQRNRISRIKMLNKRWANKLSIMAGRRVTIDSSLKFPTKRT